jgi:predicted nucleic acid-binding protein
VIVYLDSSALVKLVVEEAGSARVRALLAKTTIAATGLISRAEVAAALAKAIRIGFLD